MYKFSSLILNEHNSRCLSNCMVNKYCLRFLIRRHEFRNQVGMLTQLLFCIENTDLVLESSPGQTQKSLPVNKVFVLVWIVNTSGSTLMFTSGWMVHRFIPFNMESDVDVLPVVKVGAWSIDKTPPVVLLSPRLSQCNRKPKIGTTDTRTLRYVQTIPSYG